MFHWKETQYRTATPAGYLPVRGFVYRGIGIEPVADEDGGVWHTDWDVTHIASGSLIGTIVGLDQDEAIKFATMLAEVADWDTLAEANGLAIVLPSLGSHLSVLADLFGGRSPSVRHRLHHCAPHHHIGQFTDGPASAERGPATGGKANKPYCADGIYS
jgi:hypothetical protein